MSFVVGRDKYRPSCVLSKRWNKFEYIIAVCFYHNLKLCVAVDRFEERDSAPGVGSVCPEGGTKRAREESNGRLAYEAMYGLLPPLHA